MLRWVGHSVHEQVDVVGPILEIIEWLEVLEAVREAIEILIEQGLDWFRSLNVSRFR